MYSLDVLLSRSGSKSYLTLLRPHGLQPIRLLVHGISQARILEWVTISFSRRRRKFPSLHFNYETALLTSLKMHMEGSMAEVAFLSYSFQNSINYVLIVLAQ